MLLALLLHYQLTRACMQGAGAWEPKQKTGKKARHAARVAAAVRPQKPAREGGEPGGPSSPSDEEDDDDDDEDASEAGGGDQLVGQAQVRRIGAFVIDVQLSCYLFVTAVWQIFHLA